MSQHEKYSKYFKMLKVGIIKPQVQQKMRDEGVNEIYLDLKPDELVPIEDTVNTIGVAEHPVYKKYFKMLKVGVPKVTVREKMELDGIDPEILEFAPDHLVQLTEVRKFNPSAKSSSNGDANTAHVRKKRVLIQGLDASKLASDSLWAEEADEDIDLDDEEFQRLFRTSAEVGGGSGSGGSQAVASTTSKSQRADSANVAGKPPQECLIDAKRAQNAAISLARIKFSFEQLRVKIEQLDDENLTVDQLLSLRDYLPTTQEKRALSAYRGNVSDLATAERYMHTMLRLSEGHSRISCMLLKLQFPAQVHVCKEQLCQIEMACDDVKTCARLKKVLKTILKVGNQLQDGVSHVGLSIASLLQLQNTKAFDKKTSVLQYVICIIARQDPDALLFVDDIASINTAARLSLEVIVADKTALQRDLEQNTQFITTISAKNSAEHPNAGVGKMKEFLHNKAKHQCEDLEKRIAKVSGKFSQLLAYFGEEPTMPCQEFFTLLSRFVLDFVSVREQVGRSMRAEERKLKETDTKDLSKRQSTGTVATKALLSGGLPSTADLAEGGSATSLKSVASRRPSSMRVGSADSNLRRAELLSGLSTQGKASTAVSTTTMRRASNGGVRFNNDGIAEGTSSTNPSTIANIQAQVRSQVRPLPIPPQPSPPAQPMPPQTSPPQPPPPPPTQFIPTAAPPKPPAPPEPPAPPRAALSGSAAPRPPPPPPPPAPV